MVPAAAQWQVCRLGDGLGQHASAWDELNLRLFAGHPLLDSAFVGGLLRAFGDGRQHLCLLEQDGVASGMCILQRDRLGVWRSFLPSQAHVGPTLLAGSEALSGLFAALPGTAKAIELLCYDPRYGNLHLDGQQPSDATRHSVTINIPLVGGFDTYWGRRSTKLRDDLSHYLRHTDATGETLHYSVTSAVGEIEAAVRRYAELEGRDVKGEQGTALGSNPSQLRFYVDLMLGHARRGQAFAAELWAGQKLVASRLVVAQGGLVVVVKSTPDEEMRDWGPGRLLMQRFIEDAFSRWPGASLEFYTNASVDQLAWADGQRSILDVTVFADRARALLARAWKSFLQHLHATAAVKAAADAIDAVVICDDGDGLSPAEAELLARAEGDHFQCGRDWFDLFIRTVAPSPEGARLLALRRGSLAAAVLPVNLDPKLAGLGGAVGALSNFYSALYAPAFAADTVGVDLVPLFETLRSLPGVRPSLDFAPMDPRSRGYGVLCDGLRAAGYAVFDYFVHGNWYLPVTGDWQQYLARRPGALRHTIQRMSKKFAQAGGWVEVVTQPEDLPLAIAAYQKVYANSWKRPEPVPDFMPEMMAWCARRGWLRLGLAWLGDMPISAQVWVVANGRAAIYKLAYDDAYAHMAPGTVLSAHLMERAIDVDKVCEVDYLVGDDAYKRDWMSHRRERRGLVGFDMSTWAGRWLATRAAAAYWVRRSWPGAGKTASEAVAATAE